MKKKQATSPKTLPGKSNPRIRLQKNKTPIRKPPPSAGTAWDDDKAFRVLMKNSRDIFALIDSRGKIIYRSPSAVQVGGVPGRNVAQTNILEWVFSGDTQQARDNFSQIIRSPGREFPFQFPVKGKNGVLRWVEGVAINYLADPAIGAILLSYRDITDRKRQEEALQESEQRYRNLFENARLAIFQSTPEGKVLRVNNEFARMFGYRSPEDVFESVKNVGTDLYADPARREEIIRLQKKDPTLSIFENLYRRKDGSNFWGRLNIRSATDSRGNVSYFEGFIEDITKSRTMDESLRESEEKYRNLFANSLEGIGLSKGNRIIDANRAALDIFGYEKLGEFVAVPLLDHVAPESRGLIREYMEKAKKGELQARRFTYKIVRKNGEKRDVEISVEHLNLGNEVYAQSTFRDVTDRIRAEEALRESEKKYKTVTELTSDYIFRVDVQEKGNWLLGFVSQKFLSDTGRTINEASTVDRWKNFIHPDDLPRLLQFGQTVEAGQSGNLEIRSTRKDGAMRWVSIFAQPEWDEQREKVVAIVGAVKDITQRKQAEEALRESEEKYRSLFANSLDGITLAKGEQIIAANQAMLDIFGYENLEEFLAVPPEDTVAPESKKFIREFTEKARKGEPYDKRFTYKIIRKNGEKRDVEFSLAQIQLGGEVYTHSTFRDATDRIRSEEALREKEERFRATFENANVGVCIVGLDGRLLQVNRQMCAIFGYSREEIEQMNIITIGHPEDTDIRPTLIHEAVSGETDQAGFDKRYIHKDGHVLWGHVSSSLVRDSQGKPLYFISHMQDITERKRAEEELRALALRHEALLAAIPEIVMEVDNNKIYTWANPAGREFFGDDVIGKEAAYYFEGDQDVYTEVQPLFNGSEGTIYVESWQRRKDGQKRLLAWWYRTLKNSLGEVTGALSSARDITEQKQAAEQIQILSRFPTENPNPVMRIAPDGNLLFANHASQPFLTAWNIPVGQTVPEEYRELVREVFASNKVKDIEMTCGEQFFLCSLTPVASEGYINLYGRDITKRKQAEESLARQTEELRLRNLELTRLGGLTERRMQHLAAMRTVDMAISSSFKSELVMNILLEQLTSQLNVHAADILIFHPAMQGFRFFCGRGFYSTPSSSDYLRLADSYAGRATQERKTIKVPRLDEKADGQKIFPKIAKEGFVSYLCLPLVAKGQIKGVMEIYHRDVLDLSPEDDAFLEMLAGQAAIAVDNAEMFDHLQSSRDELQLAFNSTLSGWARALEMRNHETEGETQRGADLAMRLAQMMGESENDLTHIYRGAILHDVGMIAVPDSILLKSGPLTDEEWTILRRHPQTAFEILSPVLFLRPALDIPHCHHERWDGSGYPRGLKGEHIPLPGRIFAVVDVWDALHSDRPYRKAWTDLEANDYIRNQAGKHFDPAVVQAFFRSMAGR